jgi:hypothetical protein
MSEGAAVKGRRRGKGGSPGLHGTALPKAEGAQRERRNTGETPRRRPKGLVLTAPGPQAPLHLKTATSCDARKSDAGWPKNPHEGSSPHGRDATGGSGSQGEGGRESPVRLQPDAPGHPQKKSHLNRKCVKWLTKRGNAETRYYTPLRRWGRLSLGRDDRGPPIVI